MGTKCRDGGKLYKGRRNWKEYNEELTIKGTFFLGLDFASQCVRNW